MTQRPSIEDVKRTFSDTFKKYKKFWFPKTKNKGAVGQKFEKILGIPTSSACLDCSDGEVKVFPLKTIRGGKFVPKETVAITMRGLNRKNLSNPLSWIDSDLKKKTHNMLFIPYYRDGDYIICRWEPIHFGYLSPEYIQFENDYKTITNHYKCYGIRKYTAEEKEAEWKNKGVRAPSLNTINGTYIQGRTKGPGGNAPKTVALYFRNIEFVRNVIWSKNQ